MERWQLENDNFIDINLSSIHKKSVKRCNAGINIKAPDPNFRKHAKLKPKGRYKLLQNMGIAPTTQIIVCSEHNTLTMLENILPQTGKTGLYMFPSSTWRHRLTYAPPPSYLREGYAAAVDLPFTGTEFWALIILSLSRLPPFPTDNCAEGWT